MGAFANVVDGVITNQKTPITEQIKAANEKAGLPQITKWYLGKPGDAFLIYTDGMEVPEATAQLVQKYSGTSTRFECLNKLIQQP
jgi:hypothetical protein